MPYLVQATVDSMILYWRPSAVSLAMRLQQLAVHMHQPFRARPLMQVIDILRTEKESIKAMCAGFGSAFAAAARRAE